MLLKDYLYWIKIEKFINKFTGVSLFADSACQWSL